MHTNLNNYLVLITVNGMRSTPLIVRATTPKPTACKAPISFPGCLAWSCPFKKCRDEKYNPTPGTHRVIDCEQPKRNKLATILFKRARDGCL